MSISKRDVLVFLFKHKWVIGSIMALTSGLVTVAVYLLPQNYTAQSKVLVERTKAPTLRTQAAPGAELGEVIFDAIEIVRSRSVMESVVDKLQLDQLPPGSGAIARFVTHVMEQLVALGLLDPTTARERWIRALLKDVEVRAALDSNVFTVSFADQNPVLAADVTNAVTDAFLVKYERIYSYEDAVNFYRENLARAKAELDEAESMRKKIGETATLDARNSTLAQEQVVLRKQLAELQLALADTQSRFAAEHPKVRLAREKIAGTRSRLETIAEQIGRLERAREQIDGTQLLVNARQETYLSYKRQYDQALLNAVAGRLLLNVHVVDRAAVPSRPRFPRLIYILVSVIAGGLLALGAALVRESYDHRVRRPEDAERILGAPVIGSVGRMWRPQ